MRSRLNITVSGKVQGIGFRRSIKEAADELSVCGYARNLMDGSVYIEAEGEKPAIDSFLKWLKSDPDHSKIDHFDIKENKVWGYREFKIY